MGALFSDCFEKKTKKSTYSSSTDDNDYDYHRITHVAPRQIEDKSQTIIIQEQPEKFYSIPKESKIDKVIEYLDEAPIISDKDALMLNEALSELHSLKKTYNLSNSLNQSTSVQKSQNLSQKQPDTNKSFTISPNDYDQGTNLKRSRTLGISFRNPFKGSSQKKGTFLMISIQSAKFLHEEIITKHNLQKAYVVVKIYLKSTTKRRDNSSPPAKAEIKSFTTKMCEELVKPSWEETFEYSMKIKDDEKEAKFALYSVGVSLFYSYATGKADDVWQVGEEQHFSLSSLKDQKMQVKTVDYKDSLLKGVLAKLNITLQLVHDMEQLKERLSQDIDLRIERLLKVKERHMPLSGQKFGNANLLGSLGNIQSVASVYSSTGLKENKYFLS